MPRFYKNPTKYKITYIGRPSDCVLKTIIICTDSSIVDAIEEFKKMGVDESLIIKIELLAVEL